MVNEISGKALSISSSATAPAQSTENADVTVARVGELKQGETATLANEANQLNQVDKVEHIAKTADKLNQIAQSINRSLKFSVDDRTGDVVIAVIDSKTEEVVRQIPEERVLAIRENIDSLKGILFSAKI